MQTVDSVKSCDSWGFDAHPVCHRNVLFYLTQLWVLVPEQIYQSTPSPADGVALNREHSGTAVPLL